MTLLKVEASISKPRWLSCTNPPEFLEFGFGQVAKLPEKPAPKRSQPPVDDETASRTIAEEIFTRQSAREAVCILEP